MAEAVVISVLAIALAFRGMRTDLDWWGALGVFLGTAGFLGLAAATIAIWRPVEMTVNLNAGNRVELRRTAGRSHEDRRGAR